MGTGVVVMMCVEEVCKYYTWMCIVYSTYIALKPKFTLNIRACTLRCVVITREIYWSVCSNSLIMIEVYMHAVAAIAFLFSSMITF